VYTALAVYEGIISIYLQDSDKWISVSSPTSLWRHKENITFFIFFNMEWTAQKTRFW